MTITGSGSRQRALIVVLSGNMLIDALEVSTVVVAMPSVSGSFHVSAAAASWLVISFAAGFGGFILPGRVLTRRLGARAAYLGALLVFAVASLAGACAVNLAILIASRVIKGMTVAMTAPTGLAIIGTTFPEGPVRNRAMSVYALLGASGFSAGLLASGALTTLSWRWTLLVGGLLALALFPVAFRLIPRDRADGPARAAAPPGRPQGGTGSFARWPLIAAAAGAAALNGSYWGFLFLATFGLHDTLGWSPLAVGLALLPASLPTALTATFLGRAAARIGPSRFIATGSLSVLAGYAWYFGSDRHPAYLPHVLPATVLIGVGYMLSFSALHLRAVSGVAPARIGLAVGAYQTSVQVGGAVVLALAAVVAGPASGPRTVLAVAGAGLLIAAADVAVTQLNVVRERHGHLADPSRRHRWERAHRPPRAVRDAMAAQPDKPAR